MLANFVTYGKILIKDVTHRKVFPTFENLSKCSITGQKSVTKIFKNARKVKLQA